MIRNSNIVLFFTILVLLITSSSCSSKKFLSEDDYLVRSSDFKVVDQRSDLYLQRAKAELKNLPHIKPNTRRLFVFPRERTWLRINQKEEKSSWNEFVLRNFAEEPALFDSLIVDQSSRAFERHLRSKGYFNAKVTTKVELENQKAHIQYLLHPGRLFLADSLNYITRDTAVKELLEKTMGESFLSSGNPISRENYDREVRRVTELLRNRGYYEFYPNYLSALQLGDTSKTNIAVSIEIAPPLPDSLHRRYFIRDITVFADHDPFARQEITHEFKRDSIHYKFRNEPQIRVSRIENNIFFRRGDLYNMEEYNKTIRRLGNLSYYRFPSIIIDSDTEDGYYLDYTILLRPNLKFAQTASFELSYSRIQPSTSLLGFLFSHSLENRNVFGGSEQLVINFEAGFETPLRSISSGNTFNISIGADLISPRFRDYNGMLTLANRLRIGDRKLLGDDFYNQIRTESDIKVSANAGMSQYQLFYRYVFMNLGYGVTIQRSPTRFYDIKMLGINYWSPTELSDFDQLIGEDILFRRRFSKRLITGFLFKELAFRHETRPNRFGESYALLANFELSGLEIGLINSTSRLLGGERLINEVRLGNDTITFAKYVRLDLDARFTKAYTSTQTLATRGFIGLAIPLSKRSNIPYIKQYTAGGAFSVRAWQLRELGPGSLRDTIAEERNILFYQARDFRLEFNAEYRFNLFWLLEGAFFADVGNVWNLGNDADRRSRLKWNFYEELAIGAGFGLRLNFDLFIARFDFAYKIKEPFKDPKTDSYWVMRSFRDLYPRNMTVNFAIGYPF